MVLCPHTCPAMYTEHKACFINAAMVGGMLSIDLPLQNKSRLHLNLAHYLKRLKSFFKIH